MKPNSILYYPHIEFQNEAWVKSSLLLWDHVYRIVPEGYSPNDSDEIKALVDEDLVRDIKLDDKDREDTFDEFLKLCERIENRMPAGLIPSYEDRIHPGKIDNRLYPFLDLIGEYFIDKDNWLHLSKELARGYMFKLSQVVARIRNLNRGTDDLDAWSINPYFCENANFGDFLQDPTAKGFFCSVTLEDIVPKNIGEVSARELVTFVNKRKDERYIRIDGKPVFVFYHAEQVFCIKEMLKYWNTLALKNGLEGLYIIGAGVTGGRSGLDAAFISEPTRSRKELLKKGLYTIKNGVTCFKYEDFVSEVLTSNVFLGTKTYFCGVPGYDTTPRRGTNGECFLDNSSELFKKMMDGLYKKSIDNGNEYLFINAWNEWGEGM